MHTQTPSRADAELPRMPPSPSEVPQRPPPARGPGPEPVPEQLPGDTPEPGRGPKDPPPPMHVRSDPPTITLPVGSSLDDIERTFIVATLAHFGGDKRRAADVLGCSVKTLYNKLHLYRRRNAPTEC